MCGFRDEDIARGAAAVFPDDKERQRQLLALMREYYNGYRFMGSSEAVYNSTLCIYLFDALMSKNTTLDRLQQIADDNVTADFVDHNVSVSENLVKLIRATPGGLEALTRLALCEPMAVNTDVLRAPLRLRELLGDGGHINPFGSESRFSATWLRSTITASQH